MKAKILSAISAIAMFAALFSAGAIIGEKLKTYKAPNGPTILTEDYPRVKWHVKGMHEGKEIELYATEISWYGRSPDVTYRPDITVTEATVATSMTGIKTYVIKSPYNILPIEWVLPDMKHSN